MNHRDASTEQKILNAARAVFLRKGTAGARMQEIAEEAEVNQALLHYYFKSKAGLSAAVFREVAGDLIPSLVRLLSGEDSLETKIERVVHLYIDTLRRNPFIPGYVISELHHYPDRVEMLAANLIGRDPAQFVDEVMRELGAQLQQYADAGLIKPVTVPQFLINLVSLCVFPFAARPLICHLFPADMDGFDAFLDERRRELPRFIVNALRP